MGNKSTKPYAVIAIDFGTTYSGYAFSFSNDKDNIILNQNWNNTEGQFYKTPTCVLYDKDGKFKNFGFQAERDYCNTDNFNGNERPSLYRNFKLQLHQQYRKNQMQGNSEFNGLNFKLQSEDSQEKKAIEVFEDALRYLKEHALERIKNFHGGLSPANLANILWVITVPAMWETDEKIFMRIAAEHAGIIDETHSENLLIAFEPECASVYCQHKKSEYFHEKFNDTGKTDGETAYMVVDVGGGTTDFIFHRLIGKSIEEIHVSEGMFVGGHRVNLAFEKLLMDSDVLGSDFINDLKKSKPLLWFNLMDHFENAKRNYSDNSKIIFALPAGIAEYYNEFNQDKGKEFKDVFKSNKKGISLTDQWQLVISECTAKKLIDDVVAKIHKHVDGKLKEIKTPVSHILLVGGFAECSLLGIGMENLNRGTETKLKILIPHEANLCVLRGAVQLGHNPNIIKSRFSRVTYAVLSEREYQRGKDDIKRKDSNGRVKYLDYIIKRGQKVEQGTVVEKVITLSAVNGVISIDFYTSRENNVDYPDAKHVRKLGSIEMKRKANTYVTGKMIHIQVIIKFCMSEMTVTAYDKEIKQEARVSFNLEDRENVKCTIM